MDTATNFEQYGQCVPSSLRKHSLHAAGRAKSGHSITSPMSKASRMRARSNLRMASSSTAVSWSQNSQSVSCGGHFGGTKMRDHVTFNHDSLEFDVCGVLILSLSFVQVPSAGLHNVRLSVVPLSFSLSFCLCLAVSRYRCVSVSLCVRVSLLSFLSLSSLPPSLSLLLNL